MSLTILDCQSRKSTLRNPKCSMLLWFTQRVGLRSSMLLLNCRFHLCFASKLSAKAAAVATTTHVLMDNR